MIKKGKYIPCTNCPPLLSFSSSKIKVDLNRHIVIQNPLVRLFNIPFFYFPLLYFPLKDGENEDQSPLWSQSGFLFPQLDFTNLGFIFSESFLIFLSHKNKLTVTGKYYSKRGFKAHLNHKYKISQESYNYLNAALINDHVFETLSLNHRKRKALRGYIEYQSYYFLPFDFLQRTSINYVSDLRYNQDYPYEVGFHGDSALENRLSITKNLNQQHISTEMAYYINLLKTNPFKNNDDAIHRFPEIKYSFLERRIGQTNFLYKFDLDYVHFFKKDLSYNSSYDALFGEENKFSQLNQNKIEKSEAERNAALLLNQIQAGQRIKLNPKLHYFISLFKKADIESSLSYNDLFYQFDRPPSSSLRRDVRNPTHATVDEKDDKKFGRQSYLDFEASLRTRFHRVFHIFKSSFKHEFEPEISYYNTPWYRSSDHRFFGNFENLPYSQRFVPVSDIDFLSENKKIQFDYEDRLFDHQIVKIALTHRMIQKKILDDGKAKYKNVILFRTEESFDLNNYKKIKDQPWSPIRNLFQFSLDQFRFQQVWDYYPYARVSHWDSRFQVRDKKHSFLELSYQKAFVIKEDNSFNYDERTENLHSAVGFTSRFFDFVGELTHSLVSKKLQKWSYFVVFKPPGNCLSLKFKQTQEIGDANPYFNIKLNFNF